MPSSDPANSILVNDRSRSWPSSAPLQLLLEELGIADRRGVAVAVNDAVVPRNRWPEHMLTAGARVLVVRATQGG